MMGYKYRLYNSEELLVSFALRHKANSLEHADKVWLNLY